MSKLSKSITNITVCGIVSAMMMAGLSTSSQAVAYPAETAVAGASITLQDYYKITPELTQMASEAPIVAAVELEPSIFDNIAVSRVTDYVNVRSEPNTDSEILGKIYDGCAATIVAVEGDWYKIDSGNIKGGYIKAEYFVTGAEAEALATELAVKFGTVNTTTLNVREQPTTDSIILTMVPMGEEFAVLEEQDGWARIEIDGNTAGWVSMEFLDNRVEFDTAVTVEEEEQRNNEKSAAEQRAADARRALEEQQAAEEASRAAETTKAPETTKVPETTTVPETTAPIIQDAPPAETTVPETAAPETTTAETTTIPETTAAPIIQDAPPAAVPETAPAAESNGTSDAIQSLAESSTDAALREAIVSYALQFVGNPYVYGGNSLTNGTDCSGFVKLIYAEFGYNLERRASYQYMYNGTQISMDNIKPGDLIFYGNGQVDHVTMYIGNGQVVHASTERTGIKVSNLYYRSVYGAVRILD